MAKKAETTYNAFKKRIRRPGRHKKNLNKKNKIKQFFG